MIVFLIFVEALLFTVTQNIFVSSIFLCYHLVFITSYSFFVLAPFY